MCVCVCVCVFRNRIDLLVIQSVGRHYRAHGITVISPTIINGLTFDATDNGVPLADFTHCAQRVHAEAAAGSSSNEEPVSLRRSAGRKRRPQDAINACRSGGAESRTNRGTPVAACPAAALRAASGTRRTQRTRAPRMHESGAAVGR